jgi:hypothetical protein
VTFATITASTLTALWASQGSADVNSLAIASIGGFAGTMLLAARDSRYRAG